MGLFRIDLFGAILILIFSCLFLPSISRFSSDAPLLAAFSDDEPIITMQLDGMTAWPFGNPANYLDSNVSAQRAVPARWLNIRYYNIPYYGGFYLDLAAVLYAPLKLLGAPVFPTAPIVLRFLALAFSTSALLAAYNLGRSLFGAWAGIASGVFLISNRWFIDIGTVIHPDTLLLLLDYLALALVIRHARRGDYGSFVALGIVIGVAQGTKLGGLILFPIGLIGIICGIWPRYFGISSRLKQIISRCAALGLIAMVSFAATTPYAFLDRYYFHTWGLWSAKLTAASSQSPAAFMDWLAIFGQNVGVIVLGLGAIGGTILIARSWQQRRFPAAYIYLALGTSVLAWYAALDRYWVQPQYLLAPMVLVAALAGYVIDQAIIVSEPLLSPGACRLLRSGATVFLLFLFPLFLRGTVAKALSYEDWRESPEVALGQWSVANIPTGSRVMWDLQAYFPASSFPDQHMNGGPIRYIDVANIIPNYFVLTLYAVPDWMNDKISASPLPRWSPDHDNMRMYQDILGNDVHHPHPRDIPDMGFKYITSAGAEGVSANTCGALDEGILQEVRAAFRAPCSQIKTLFLFRVDRQRFHRVAPTR